jgi:hypothetical protein
MEAGLAHTGNRMTQISQDDEPRIGDVMVSYPNGRKVSRWRRLWWLATGQVDAWVVKCSHGAGTVGCEPRSLTWGEWFAEALWVIAS